MVEVVPRHDFTPAEIGEPADLVTCDVSFISAPLVVGPAAALLRPEGRMVILVGIKRVQCFPRNSFCRFDIMLG